MADDKISFAPHADVNRVQLMLGGRELVLESGGVVYTTSDPLEIAALDEAASIKRVPVPDKARSGSKTKVKESGE